MSAPAGAATGGRRGWRRALAAAALAAGALGCGGKDGTAPEPRPARVEVMAPARELAVGQVVQLIAVARDAGGDEMAVGDFAWTSTAPGIADVTETGLLTARAVGAATVAAVARGTRGELAVDVQAPPSAVVDVTMPGNTFAPATARVRRGGQVRFVFPAVPHNVIFGAVAGRPADIQVTSNTTVTRTFGAVGDFPYDCTLHPGMKGTVQVR